MNPDGEAAVGGSPGAPAESPVGSAPLADGPAAGSSKTTIAIEVDEAGDANQFIAYQRAGDQFNVTISEMVAQAGFGAGPDRLTEDHFTTLIRADLDRTITQIVCDSDEVEQLVHVSQQHQLLLLEGRRGLGKGQLALKVASRLCGIRSLERLQRSSVRMSRHLQVDLHRLFSKTRSFEKSVILIEDAFDFGNDSLVRLARGTDAAARDSLESSLRQKDTWLILTYDDSKHPDLHHALADRRHVVRGPKPEQLVRFLERSAQKRVAQLEEGAASQISEALRVFLENHGRTIASSLGSASRIERFVNSRLLKLVDGRESNLEAALAETDQLDTWLFEEVVPDLPALVFVLALTLCHAGPEAGAARWFEFEVLRQRLALYLRRELGKHRETRDSSDLCAERELLRRLRVEIAPGPGGPVVRFLDDRQAELIWGTLLGNGRQLAALLIPWLESLATAKEYFLRRLAGWALGRLGSLDHQALFNRVFSFWANRSSDPGAPQLTSFGALLQAAFGGTDTGLAKSCRESLRGLLNDSSPDRVRAGLLSLVDLGLIEPEFAVAEMQPVFRKWLLPPLKGLEKWEGERRRIESAVQQRYGSYRLRSQLSRVVDQDLEHALHFNLSKIFGAERELKVLTASQYALVGLGFGVGLIPVVRELKAWLPAGKTELAPVLSLLFLRPQGIIEILEQYNIRWNEGASREEKWSPILVSAMLEERGVAHLADFLFELYLGAGQFPHAIERALLTRWIALVELWTRQAATSGPRCRELVLNLWAHLWRLPDIDLRQKLADLVNHPEFGIPGTELGNVVEEIRQQRSTERSRRHLGS